MGHYYVKEDETFNTTRNGTVPKPTQEDVDGNKVLKADGTWGEGGGGASSMADLTDVDLTGLSDGDTLVYDEEEEKFVPGSSGNVDGVEVNGESVVDENKVAKIVSYKELTRAEYDALPDTKLEDGVMYCIKDGFSNPNGFPPLIYSTEEREVGVWIDGKPLYQKTVSLGNLTKDSNWHIVNHNIQDIDTIANFNAFMLTDNSGWYSMNVYRPDYTFGCVIQANKTSFHYLNNWQTAATNAYATIWYTKTTDTPGSGKWATDGGLAKHYSTQEQIIGTWIDGKPIYERIITLTSTTNVPAGTWTTIYTDSFIGTIEQMIKCLYIVTSNGGAYDSMLYKPVGNNLQSYLLAGSFNFNSTNKLIIQYTKTTD